MKNSADAFVSWITRNAGKWRERDSEEIADMVYEQLEKIDGGLGVEVSGAEESGADRELIFTAFSDRSLFSTVEDLVHRLPRVPGWKWIALKPARGYDFSISMGEHDLEAGSLQFAPLSQSRLGIRLLLPAECYRQLPEPEAATELAWLIVETGIGEELASQIEDLGFSPMQPANSKPIAELERYVRDKAS